jgi:hypothetical protein
MRKMVTLVLTVRELSSRLHLSGSLEGHRGELIAEVFQPSFNNFTGNKINLVEYQNQLLFAARLKHSLLDTGTAASQGITSIQDLQSALH